MGSEPPFFSYLELKPHPKPYAPTEMDLARAEEVNRCQQNRGWLTAGSVLHQATKKPEEPMERNKSLDLITRSSE